MSKKELEAKILKHLHKVNRGKVTKSKLEKIDELLDMLRTISDSSPAEQQTDDPHELTQERLAQYAELCAIHKLKFQLDALLIDIKRELKTIEKSAEPFSQEHFDSLLQRLHVILDMDAEHPEVPVLLDALTRSFPQYAEHSPITKAYIDLAPYQAATLLIEVECPLKEVRQSPALDAIYTTNRVDTSPENQNDSEAVCRLRFSQEELDTFEAFHEELHTKPTYHIFVNTRPVDENAFTSWFTCYKRSLHANNPQYCYGASPLTFNFFGCHKLSMPDVARHADMCWFRFGTFEQKSGIFLIDRHCLIKQLRQHMGNCGFCPILTQQKLNIGTGLLPRYINPECDPHWKYLYHEGESVGVFPVGNEIVTSLQPQEAEKVDLTTVIEIGHTPSIDSILSYLATEDVTALHQKKYKGISRCLNCGATYKPHTMICPKCKIDFEKYAVRNPEAALKELTYSCPLAMPSAENLAVAPKSSQADEEKASVSFEQLWNDPKVQEILSPPQELSETEPLELQPIQPDVEEIKDDVRVERYEQEPPFSVAPTEGEERASRPERRRSDSSGRFDLHGKLRGLVSKKYRERRALEHAFSDSSPQQFPFSHPQNPVVEPEFVAEQQAPSRAHGIEKILVQSPPPANVMQTHSQQQHIDSGLLDAVKKLRPRQKSELSKRGVVRVIYHATIDKDVCPLCEYLDGMVMDPDDPSTDIFSPPLFPGCTCSREYVLKTEKPSKWPQVTFAFPPKELLRFLEKE
ncbi:hypothetical protein CSA56_14020 [candidate division KSB3 bacterium]|uniref:Uncharacterized protein n=1 Tax=candidate division KSB3 bacterium TaxID=2044937 RepID=A0A2G6KDD3_9BACT|nr:MAG: hypothetical protein CSA56_14020 [candidate division KSB3 bacterium]